MAGGEISHVFVLVLGPPLTQVPPRLDVISWFRSDVFVCSGLLDLSQTQRCKCILNSISVRRHWEINKAVCRWCFYSERASGADLMDPLILGTFEGSLFLIQSPH